MVKSLFPQDEGTGVSEVDSDWDDAGNFAQLAYTENTTDFISTGYRFENVDHSAATFDVTEGVARISSATVSTQSHTAKGGPPARTLTGATFVAQNDRENDLSFSTGVVNHVFLVIDPSLSDSVNINVKTSDTPPVKPSLKLGTIDNTSQTSDDSYNRQPNAKFNQLSASTATVASTPSSSSDVVRKQEIDPLARKENIPNAVAVENEGTQLYSDVAGLNFGPNLSVADDGDETVTITTAPPTQDTHVDISDSGTSVLTNASAINFGQLLSASDGGNGVATVHANVAHSDLTGVTSDQHHTRYTDTESVSAIETEGTLNIDITGDAATVDGRNPDDHALRTRTIDIQSQSGTEYIKVCELSDTSTFGQGRAKFTLNFARGPGYAEPRTVEAYTACRESAYGFQAAIQGSDTGALADILLTESTTTDSNGNLSYYVYVRADNFLEATLTVSHSSAFGEFDVQTGLAETDLIGNIVGDSSTPSARVRFGELYSEETLALPEYDDVANAPTNTRSLIKITGNGPADQPEGIYRYDGGQGAYVRIDLPNVIDIGQLGTMPGDTATQDFRVENVSTDATIDIADVFVSLASTPGFDAKYNTDTRVEWDSTNGHWDLVITVNWDELPGTGNDVTLNYTVTSSTKVAAASWSAMDIDGPKDFKGENITNVGTFESDRGPSKIENVSPGEVQSVIDAVTNGTGGENVTVRLESDTVYQPSAEWHVKPGVTLDFNGALLDLSGVTHSTGVFLDHSTKIKDGLVFLGNNDTITAFSVDDTRAGGNYGYGQDTEFELEAKIRSSGCNGTGLSIYSENAVTVGCRVTLDSKFIGNHIEVDGTSSGFVNGVKFDIHSQGDNRAVYHTGSVALMSLFWGTVQASTSSRCAFETTAPQGTGTVNFRGVLWDPHKYATNSIIGPDITCGVRRLQNAEAISNNASGDANQTTFATEKGEFAMYDAANQNRFAIIMNGGQFVFVMDGKWIAQMEADEGFGPAGGGFLFSRVRDLTSWAPTRNTGQWACHDGTGSSNTKGPCCSVDGSWYNLLDGTVVN